MNELCAGSAGQMWSTASSIDMTKEKLYLAMSTQCSTVRMQWRVIVTEDFVHFFSKRDKKYNFNMRPFGAGST
jgi:hypothetical protein